MTDPEREALIQALEDVIGKVARCKLYGPSDAARESLSRAADVLAAFRRAPAPAPQEPRIVCGRTSMDDREEEMIQQMRQDVNAPDDTSGCGTTCLWKLAFRCAECGRWFHRDCIQKHFAAHSQSPAPAPQGQGWQDFTRLTVVQDGIGRVLEKTGVTLTSECAGRGAHAEGVPVAVPVHGGRP